MFSAAADHYYRLPFFIGIAAFVTSVGIVPLVRRCAVRLRAVAHPGAGRVHVQPTPYLGGVAIALTALIGVWFVFGNIADSLYVLSGALIVALVGLVDDLRHVHPYVRLGIEYGAAVVAVGGGASIQLFGNWLDPLASVVLIVLVTNSFNLLDNMDGVASAVAALRETGALGVAAILQQQSLVGALATGLFGAVAGFLVYNRHPASIFMGDAGSLFVGFLVSVLALKLRTPAQHFASVTAVALILAVPMLDTTLVVISRVRAGRSVFQGGKDHLSHRLNRLGVPVRWVAPLLGIATLAVAACGVAVGRKVVSPILVLAVIVPVSVLTLVGLLRLDVYADESSRMDSRVKVPAST